jgi:hypothetical protein
MSFWDKALGGGQPAAPQQPQQPAAGSHAWWRSPAQQQQQAGAYGIPQAVPVAPADDLGGHDVSKATHLRTAGTCPDCGSGNLAPTGKVTTRHGQVESTRCFDCGWPVAHSTKGMGGLASGAADGAARQIATGGLTNNFQPQNTIAGAIRTAADLR